MYEYIFRFYAVPKFGKAGVRINASDAEAAFYVAEQMGLHDGLGYIEELPVTIH